MPDLEVNNKADRQKLGLIKRINSTAQELVEAYEKVYREILEQLNLLMKELEQARANNEDVGADWIYRRDRLILFQQQILLVASEFVDKAEIAINADFKDAIIAGVEDQQELAETIAASNIVLELNRLPAQAIDQLAANLTVERHRINNIPFDLYEKMSDELVKGIALGKPIPTIAQAVRDKAGVGLTRALTISRTEVLRAYRESSHQFRLLNEEVITGWIWYSAANERTCPICWSKHGKFFNPEVRLNDHPNGRCTSIPKVRGVVRPSVDDGEDLFKTLPQSDQLHILGAERFERYKNGVKLSQMIEQTQDVNWGTTYKIKPLKRTPKKAVQSKRKKITGKLKI